MRWSDEVKGIPTPALSPLSPVPVSLSPYPSRQSSRVHSPSKGSRQWSGLESTVLPLTGGGTRLSLVGARVCPWARRSRVSSRSWTPASPHLDRTSEFQTLVSGGRPRRVPWQRTGTAGLVSLGSRGLPRSERISRVKGGTTYVRDTTHRPTPGGVLPGSRTAHSLR